MAAHYRRVLEIVSNTEAGTTSARTRWREYKQQGFELAGHDLGGRPPHGDGG
jgi:DNA polymerase IIIc chi subunit